MSKIGRIPIVLSSAKVEVKDKKVFIEGPKAKFVHDLPLEVSAKVEDGTLLISVEDPTLKKHRMVWGLHRALLANKVIGAEIGFEKKIKIIGLGYKAVAEGKKIVFSLGYTHKINYDVPEGVIIDIDKSGQNLVVKSVDKFILGNVCDTIRCFRLPEPYKGTGIVREGDVVRRKAGKTKGA